MELRNLLLFVEVVRQGGFSAAAKLVFTTQSTVSKAVKQLEEEVGLPLLDRHGARSTPTAAGEIVFRRALRLLAEREDLNDELAQLRGLERGVLRLGLPRIGSSVLFAPLLARYRERHPHIDIRLVEHGSDRLREILRAGEIDFAGLLLPVSEEFSWTPMRREPLMALLASDYPLAKRSSLTLLDLAETPFILFETGFTLNRILLTACERHGFTPRVVVRSSQIDLIAALAAAGLGVAFLPQMIAEQRPQVGLKRIKLNEPETDWNLGMVWRRDAHLSPAAQAWQALLDP